MAEFKQAELFGGAIVAEFPKAFGDVRYVLHRMFMWQFSFARTLSNALKRRNPPQARSDAKEKRTKYYQMTC